MTETAEARKRCNLLRRRALEGDLEGQGDGMGQSPAPSNIYLGQTDRGCILYILRKAGGEGQEPKQDAPKSWYSDNGWEAGMTRNRRVQCSWSMDHADWSQKAKRGGDKDVRKRRKAFTGWVP